MWRDMLLAESFLYPLTLEDEDSTFFLKSLIPVFVFANKTCM